MPGSLQESSTKMKENIRSIDSPVNNDIHGLYDISTSGEVEIMFHELQQKPDIPKAVVDDEDDTYMFPTVRKCGDAGVEMKMNEMSSNNALQKFQNSVIVLESERHEKGTDENTRSQSLCIHESFEERIKRVKGHPEEKLIQIIENTKYELAKSKESFDLAFVACKTISDTNPNEALQEIVAENTALNIIGVQEKNKLLSQCMTDESTNATQEEKHNYDRVRTSDEYILQTNSWSSRSEDFDLETATTNYDLKENFDEKTYLTWSTERTKLVDEVQALKKKFKREQHIILDLQNVLDAATAAMDMVADEVSKKSYSASFDQNSVRNEDDKVELIPRSIDDLDDTCDKEIGTQMRSSSNINNIAGDLEKEDNLSDDESTKASKQSFDYRHYLNTKCSGESSYSFTSTDDKLKNVDSVDIEEYLQCESLEEFEGMKAIQEKLEENITIPIFSENRCLEEQLRVNKNELKVSRVQIGILEERLNSSHQSIDRLNKERNEKYVEDEVMEDLKSKNKLLLDEVSAKDSKLNEFAAHLKSAGAMNNQIEKNLEEKQQLLHASNLSLESFNAENKRLQKELEMRENDLDCARVNVEKGNTLKSDVECNNNKLREALEEKEKILHERNLSLESFNAENARLRKVVEEREKDLDIARIRAENIQHEHDNEQKATNKLLQDIHSKESSLLLELESMAQMEKEKAIKDLVSNEALQNDLKTLHAEKKDLSKVIEVLRQNEAMEKEKTMKGLEMKEGLQKDLQVLQAENKNLSDVNEALREKTLELKDMNKQYVCAQKEIEELNKEHSRAIKNLETKESLLQNDDLEILRTENNHFSVVIESLKENVEQKAQELNDNNKQHKCDQKALSACQQDLESVSQSLLSLNKELDQAEDLVKVRISDVERLEKENKIQSQKTQEAVEQFKICQDEMVSMEKSISKLEEGCDQEQKQLMAEVTEKENLLEDAKIKIGNLNLEKAAIMEKLEESRKALVEKDVLQKQIEIENSNIKKKILDAKTQLEDNCNEFKKSNENKAKLLKEQANEFETLEHDNEQTSTDLKAARIKLENLSDEKKQLEDAKASIEIVAKDRAGKLKELKAGMKKMESLNSTLSVKVKLSQEKLRNVKTEGAILQKNYMLEKGARQQLEDEMCKFANEFEGKEKDLSTMNTELQELRDLVAINKALQLLAETTSEEKGNLAEILEEKTKVLSIKEKDIQDLKEIVAISREKIDSIQKELLSVQKELLLDQKESSLAIEGLKQSKENSEIEKCKLFEYLEGREKELSNKNAELEELKEKIDTSQKKLSLATEALQQSKDSAELETFKFVEDFEGKEKEVSVRNAEIEELKGIVALNREKIASIEVELTLVKGSSNKEIQDTKKAAEVEKCKAARDVEGKENELTIKNAEIQELKGMVILNKEKISFIQEELALSVEALQHSKEALESKVDMIEALKQSLEAKAHELNTVKTDKSNEQVSQNEVMENLRQEMLNATKSSEEYKQKYTELESLKEVIEKSRQEIHNVTNESEEYKEKYTNQQQLYEESLLKNQKAKKVDRAEINNLRKALDEAEALFKCSKEEYARNISHLECSLKEMKERSAQLIKSFKKTKRNDEMDIYHLSKDANEAKSSFEDTKESLISKISHLEYNLDEMRKVATQLNTEKNDFQKECEEKVKEISLQGKRICEFVESINEKEKKIESMQHELDEMKVSCEILKEEKAHCGKMYEEAENDGITLAMDVRGLSEKLEGARKEMASKELRIKYVEEKIEADKGFIENLKNESKTANDLLEEVSNEADADRELSEAKICALEEEISTITATQKDSEIKVDDMASKLLRLQEELIQNSKRLEPKMAEYDALKRKDAKNKVEIHSLKEEIESNKKSLLNMIQATSNERESLNEIIESLEKDLKVLDGQAEIFLDMLKKKEAECLKSEKEKEKLMENVESLARHLVTKENELKRKEERGAYDQQEIQDLRKRMDATTEDQIAEQVCKIDTIKSLQIEIDNARAEMEAVKNASKLYFNDLKVEQQRCQKLTQDIHILTDKTRYDQQHIEDMQQELEDLRENQMEEYTEKMEKLRSTQEEIESMRLTKTSLENALKDSITKQSALNEKMRYLKEEVEELALANEMHVNKLKMEEDKNSGLCSENIVLTERLMGKKRQKEWKEIEKIEQMMFTNKEEKAGKSVTRKPKVENKGINYDALVASRKEINEQPERTASRGRAFLNFGMRRKKTERRAGTSSGRAGISRGRA